MKLHKILLLFPLVALAACSDDDLDVKQTLSGKEKTPLDVTVLLDADSQVSQTRAADKDFANGDKLMAYIRHVTWNGGFTASDANMRIPVEADQAPKLVTFTCTSSEVWDDSKQDIYPFLPETVTITGNGTTPDTKQAILDATSKLYWDDFSVSTADGLKDLRTEGHYLQSFYGYCYNGGTPTEGLETGTNKEKGIIKWAVQTDQSGTTDPTNFQKSDLLWSAEQEPISYAHRDKNEDNERPGLLIPYTHAMSKVTIKVEAGVGFDNDYDFDGTTISLKNVRIVCTAEAPIAKLTYPDANGTDNVKMKPGTGVGTRAFEAIIVPSILSVGNTFATITNMQGSTYNIPVTEEMLKKNNGNGWGDQLDDAKESVDNGTAQARPRNTRAGEPVIPEGKGHEMRSGVHYVLNVKLSKTEVNVSATILDWEEVEAEGVGEIHFSNDIKDTDQIDDDLKENGFDVFKSTTTTFGSAATSLHWNKTTLKWIYDPIIYWKGGEPEYFRALSNVEAAADGTITMRNDLDALWGTTSAHKGTDADGVAYDYGEGDPLKPRTGDVPLTFYHAMSKITVYLVDSLKDNSDPLARLDLRKATIQLTNLATSGTLSLETGAVTPSAIVAKTFSEDQDAVPARMGFFAAKENGSDTGYDPDLTIKDYPITPQTIDNNVSIEITLADGTRYIAQLNKCALKDTDTPITKWERGKHYIYEIKLSKETITFRALVEPWTPVEGGGKATLEWD